MRDPGCPPRGEARAPSDPATRLGRGTMPEATVIIRPATERDWPAIYPFFSQIVAAGETYAYPEDLSLDDARAFWMAQPPGRTVVAANGTSVLGTASMGPNRPGRGSHVATASFMVDPRHEGRGVGRALGTHVIEWARTAGYRSIQFNAVVETNHVAVHLWQALGFRILTTVPETFDHARHGLVGLHLMFRSLDDVDAGAGLPGGTRPALHTQPRRQGGSGR